MSQGPHDLLAVATPETGKITLTLRTVFELMGAGIVDKLTVMRPTEHLKGQWVDAAARVSIHIDPTLTNSQGRAGSHYDGVVATYVQVVANPPVYVARIRVYPTLVILDEIHHAGDALSWGDGVCEAFTDAKRRLALMGISFRSDTSSTPFVRYEEDAGGIYHSKMDSTYGYGDALRESVVRLALFISYLGQMSWRTNSGDKMNVRLDEPLTKDMMKQAWRTALDPKGEWIPAVSRAADLRLEEVRRQVPDAGGLVTASDQTQARAYVRHLRDIMGRSVTVALSDDIDASDRIDAFCEGDDKWVVAVRMVSEGVDVPRLCVGVYTTNTSTSLLFAQAVGRFVRVCRCGETAMVFVPSVLSLLDFAGQMELERDHTLDRFKSEGGDSTWNLKDTMVAEANREEKVSGKLLKGFEVLGADVEFDGVLLDDTAWGQGIEVGSEEEQEYLGIPGLLDVEQVTTLLRVRRVEQTASARKQRSMVYQREANSGIPDHQVRAAKCKEPQHLVTSWSRRPGDAHAMAHSQLWNRCRDPEIAQATTEQIEACIASLRQWFVGRK